MASVPEWIYDGRGRHSVVSGQARNIIVKPQRRGAQLGSGATMDEVWLAEAEKKRLSWHSGVNLSLTVIRVNKGISRN